MANYNLFVGLNDKITKKQKISTIEAYKIVENICLKEAGGCSIYEGRGVYKHDDGTPVIEQSLQVQIFDVSEATSNKIIKHLLVALNQESIVRELVETKSDFIRLEDL